MGAHFRLLCQVLCRHLLWTTVSGSGAPRTPPLLHHPIPPSVYQPQPKPKHHTERPTLNAGRPSDESKKEKIVAESRKQTKTFSNTSLQVLD
ncbi:hypothetical protein BJV77DRAFT_666088 [Russula vinacea]|nr:hypothetical protein BJV77DRAFT_666088 [Russula vinacea]